MSRLDCLVTTTQVRRGIDLAELLPQLSTGFTVLVLLRHQSLLVGQLLAVPPADALAFIGCR